MGERIFTREDAKSIFRTNSEKVKLPSDFTVIGTGSLAGFSQVKDLTIPEGIHRICSHAFFIRSFRGTSKLEKLVIPSSLQDFELWCFFDCNELKSIVVPEDFPEQRVMELFFHCPQATVTFGKKLFASKKKTIQQIMDETPGILSLGSAMMLPVSDDGTLRIPSNYYYILPSAMKNLMNRGIKRIEIHEKMRVISAGAFSCLNSLEEVVFSDGLQYIDNGALAGCNNLKRIVIPDSVQRIGAGAFMNLPKLTSIRLPRNLTEIEDDLLSGCYSLTEITFGGMETRVGAGAFNECSSLKQVRLPETVESVGNCAFWNCSALQHLAIPSRAESIGQSALCNCHSLTKLYMPHIIKDGPEHKRVFGEHTAPDIVWLEPGTAAPAFTDVSGDSSFAIPEVPSSLPFGFASSAQNDQPVPSEAAPQTVLEAQASQDAVNSASSPVQGTETVDAATVQKLQETIAAMQAQIAAMQRGSQNTQQGDSADPELLASMHRDLNAMQEAVSSAEKATAAVSAMQEQIDDLSEIKTRVDEIAEKQESVQAQVDAISELQEAAGLQEMAVHHLEETAEKAAETATEQSVSVDTDLDTIVSAEDTVASSDAVIPSAELETAASETDTLQSEDILMPETDAVIAPSGEQAQFPADTVDTLAIDSEEESVSVEETVPVQETAIETETLPEEFDSCISFVPLHHGEYTSSERVFTREISKPMIGPKERSMALKEYSVIGYRSFREAQPGERFEIPEGVRRAETQAFWDAPRLMAIEIPTTLTEVEPDAFSGASRLTDIYVRDGYDERRIVEYFLFRPEAKVHWPKKGILSKPRISTIAELMEQYDDILTPAKAKKLTVRGHILQVPEGYTIIAPGALQQIDQRADDPEQVLRTIFLPKSIRRIGTKAFAGLENVMHIVIPSGLQIVDMNAFTGCLGPRRIVLPDSVQYIGPRAFAEPCNYEQIRMPGLIRELPENVLADCKTLVSVRIPDSVEKIGDCALAGCSSLSSLTIPRRFEGQLPLILDGPVKLNVTWTDGSYTSYQHAPTQAILSVVEPSFPPVNPQRLFTKELSASCSSFAERIATLHAHPYIAPFALSEMANQTKFEIPLGVMRLSSYSFGMNTRLLTLTVPKALEEFEYAAFYGCQKLRDVFLPDDFDRGSAAVLFMRRPQILVTFGSARAVRIRQLTAECPWILSPGDAADLKLDHVTLRIPEGYLVVASYMYHGIMGLQCLHRIEVPSSVRLIGSLAFVQLPYLEEVVCDEGLLAVEPDAFTDCPALKKIVLPKSLRFLGVHAFHGCNELTSIVIPSRFENRADEIKRDCPNVTITWLNDESTEEETVPAAATESLAKSGETVIPVAGKPFTAAELIEQANERAKAMLAQEDEADEQISVTGESLITESETAVADESAVSDETPAVVSELGQEQQEIDTEIIGSDSAVEEVDISAETVQETQDKEIPAKKSALDEAENSAVIETASSQDVSETVLIAGNSVETDISSEDSASEKESSADIEMIPTADEGSAEEEQVPESAFGEQAVPEEIAKIAHSLFASEQSEEQRDPSEAEQTTVQSVADDVENEELEASEISSEIHELAESLFSDIPESNQTIENNEQEPVPAIFEESADSLESSDLHDMSKMEPIAGSETTPEMIGRTQDDSLELNDSKDLSALDGAETALLNEETVESVTTENESPDVSESNVSAAQDEVEANETMIDAESDAEVGAESVGTEFGLSDETDNESNAETDQSFEEGVPAEESLATDPDGFFALPEMSDTAETGDVKTADMPDLSKLTESENLENVQTDLDINQIDIEQNTSDHGLDLQILPDMSADTASEHEESVLINPADDMPGLPDISDAILAVSEDKTDETDDMMLGLPDIMDSDQDETEIEDTEPDMYDSDEQEEDTEPEAEPDDEPDAAVLIEKMQLADALGIALDDSDIVQIMTEEPPEWPVHVEDFGSRIEPGMLPESELAGQPPIPEDGKFTAKECRLRYKGEPEFHIPHGFTEIRAGACAAMDDLEKLIVPDTVTRIGSGAFSDSPSLTEIVFPSTLEEIAEDAFEGCESLMRVTMPRSLEAMADKLFGPQTHIIWIESEKPSIIGDGRFTAKIRAKIYDDGDTLTIPEGYTEIRAGACAGLEDLKQVILPNTLFKICSGAFADCTALTEVMIPSSVTELDADAFEGCTGISRAIVSHELADAAKACFPNATILIQNS